jgi:phosphoadenosine phosphosulfate reductase
VPGTVVNEQGEGGGVVEQPICGAQGGSMTISSEIIGPLFDGNDKVAIAIARIRQFTPPEGLYVATSFGKDSIVLTDLVQKSGVKADYHFNLTTIDPPEVIQFGRKHYPFVQVHHPRMSMWDLIVYKRQPPTRLVRYCCEELKERGGADRVVATGIRWEESARRSRRRMIELCRTDTSKRFLHPIIDWTSEEVWGYIRRNKLPYPSLYDEGWKRIGCIMCPMNTKRKEDALRWPKYAEAYKRAFQRCFDKREKDGLNRPNTTWKSGEDMYNWWIDEKKEDDDDSTPWLFE